MRLRDRLILGERMVRVGRSPLDAIQVFCTARRKLGAASLECCALTFALLPQLLLYFLDLRIHLFPLTPLQFS